jgi:acetylornithine deacetylase
LPHDINEILDVLPRLIAFDTTSTRSNLDIIADIERYLGLHGIAARRIPDPRQAKCSLWVTIGPADQAGYVLSGHTDTVPVEGQAWTSDPFTLTRRGNRLFGRGTCDMKGFVSVCLAMAPRMQAAGLRIPLHLAISYDEEVGCTGVRPMLEEIAKLPVRPLGCFVGEPTSMDVVIGHKSKHSMRAVVRGKACHSAMPAGGVNAVEAAADLVCMVREKARALAGNGARDGDYEVPFTTGLTTIIRGGTANNIVPEYCEVEFEFRGVAGDDPTALCEAIVALARLQIEPGMKAGDAACGIDFIDVVEYPGLETAADADIVRLAKRLSGRNGHAKAAYGTEAGLFDKMAGVPSVVIGPGSIQQAHKPDEFVEIEQLEQTATFIERLIAHCCEGNGSKI